MLDADVMRDLSVKHMSFSSIECMHKNPYWFMKSYVYQEYSNETRSTAVEGTCLHYGLEMFYGIPTEKRRLLSLDEWYEAILKGAMDKLAFFEREALENPAKAIIYPETGSREEMIKNITQACKNASFSIDYSLVPIALEGSITEYVKDPQTWALINFLLKAKTDYVWYIQGEDWLVEIVDYKLVSWTLIDEIEPSHKIQLGIYYLAWSAFLEWKWLKVKRWVVKKFLRTAPKTKSYLKDELLDKCAMNGIPYTPKDTVDSLKQKLLDACVIENLPVSIDCIMDFDSEDGQKHIHIAAHRFKWAVWTLYLMETVNFPLNYNIADEWTWRETYNDMVLDLFI